jgi:hypothetical protein
MAGSSAFYQKRTVLEKPETFEKFVGRNVGGRQKTGVQRAAVKRTVRFVISSGGLLVSRLPVAPGALRADFLPRNHWHLFWSLNVKLQVVVGGVVTKLLASARLKRVALIEARLHSSLGLNSGLLAAPA